MSRSTTFFVIALLLFVSLGEAARHAPADPTNTQTEGVEEDSFEKMDEECGGVGKEECLMRRTLAAHTDYIYTQGKKH
ncbi:unnamed protein product [Musa acuminata subsp. malaccensis]|uniref:Phytosulfokine n=1 Tax=Musa acuminata subsp. malaccensis TaxID=214687 RepID=A0A804IGR5_MUSAM|nr:PREDICTED: phytosulfokines-like [Musa acuminata subsp. malaccensis]CAG1851405.1 unnamed protein product [Musa acuminata subsp. malaccensis]